MNNPIDYLRDLYSACLQWIFCWFHNKEVIERRKEFIDDVVGEKTKSQFPYKILMGAWNKRLKQK